MRPAKAGQPVGRRLLERDQLRAVSAAGGGARPRAPVSHDSVGDLPPLTDRAS